MRLMLHIVRKDLRRLRWPLGIWIGLLLAKYGIGFALIGGGRPDLETFRVLEIVNGVMSAVEVVLVYFLTALLVQGDRLEGSAQFWLTRPISSRRLLGAKGLGVLLLLIAPSLGLALPWWRACGFDATWMAAAATDLLMWKCLAIFPAFLVASLTDSLGRFIVWSLVLIWLSLMAPLYAQWALLGAVAGEEGRVRGVSEIQLLVTAAAMTVVIAGVVGWQYRVRRWQRSVLLLAGGSLLALAAGLLVAAGSARGEPERAGRLAETTGPGGGVALTWKEARADKITPQSFVRGATVRAQFEVTGVPAGLALAGLRADCTWRWPGEVVYQKGGFMPLPVGQDPARRAALGLPEEQPDEETEQWLRERTRPVATDFTVVTPMPPSLAARTRREPATLQLEADLELRRPVVLVQTPLQEGGWTAGGGVGVRVMDVEAEGFKREPGASRRMSALRKVSAVQSHPQIIGSPAVWLLKQLSHYDSTWWWFLPDRVWVHPRQGLGLTAPRGRSAAVSISSVTLRIEVFSVGVRGVVRNGQWVPPPDDQLEGAEYKIIDWVPVARFSRSLTVENARVAETK